MNRAPRQARDARGTESRILRRRKRNVEEKTNPVRDAGRAQRLRERNQVIVVDPDDVVGLQKRRELAGEPACSRGNSRRTRARSN